MELSITDLNWKTVLLRHYKAKAYDLTDNEVLAVFIIDDLLSIQETLVTADDLATYMRLSSDELDKILTSLLDKKDIEYKNENGKFVTSLDPLKKKILANVRKDIIIQDSEEKEERRRGEKGKIDNLYTYFEEVLGRTLSPRDVDRIQIWVRSGASEGMIKEAVEKLKARNRAVTLPAVDKILVSIQKNADITKEGYSTIDETYRHNDEETISELTSEDKKK